MPGVARKGDTHSGICDHGFDCCPHIVSGEIVGGSTDVLTNDRQTARLYDPVVHDCPHCGTGYISSASSTAKADDLGIARDGDSVTYPGGGGKIDSASSDVFAGG